MSGSGIDWVDDDEALRAAIEMSISEELIPPNRREADSNPSADADYPPCDRSKAQEKMEEVMSSIKSAKDRIRSLILPESYQDNQEPEANLEQADDESSSDTPLAVPTESQILPDDSPPDEHASSIVPIVPDELEEIPPEPTDGSIDVAVLTPERKRLIRKFSQDSPGKHVYIWVASQPEMARARIGISGFDILSPSLVLLNQESTLSQQHIETRTIFTVRLH